MMLQMFFIQIGFLDLRIIDLLDILLVAILLFYVYRLLKGSIAFNIFIGVALLYFLWFFVKNLEMRMLSRILGQFIELGVLAFVILFQPEIRRFLLLIGKGRAIAKSSILRKFFQQKEEDFSGVIESIVVAIRNGSASNTGMLIAISGSTQLQFVCATGVSLNADISSKLLGSIFDKTAPLHDGAVIISGKKILAASTTLTLSENQSLPKNVGTRHRAAVGLSEYTDATVFIVSEENGNISYAEGGVLHYNIDEKELRETLLNAFTQE